MQHLDIYIHNLRAWTRRTALGTSLQADRVLETFPLELQAKFKTVRLSLAMGSGLDRLAEHLTLLSGERPGDKDRQMQNEALFDYVIKKGESLTDYVIRRDGQMLQAESAGLTLADSIKTRYYEEGAMLSHQNRINLATLACGKKGFLSIRAALLNLDVSNGQAVLPTAATSSRPPGRTYMQEQEEETTFEAEDDAVVDLFETEFSESEADGFLISLDQQDLTEDGAYH
eukprot:862732-Pyramimonas_sp.AAC.1